MKSFCIKTNNEEIIKYLLKNLETSSLENIYFVNKTFKSYQNIIIHYTGSLKNHFLVYLSDLLTECILFFYEPILLKRAINFNYFYFDDFEKKLIEENCYKHIILEEPNLKYRKEEISNSLLNYIINNKFMILDGFINFRLENYNKTIEEIVDLAVNQYVIEKEYTEFIDLLKLYIDSKESQTSAVHIIYTNGESILLNKDKKVIDLKDNIFNVKYLSDISFSSNDYTLNALLTLLPKKIEIHLIGLEDEFINTLKLIFGKRISICTDCNLCNTYKVLNNVKF